MSGYYEREPMEREIRGRDRYGMTEEDSFRGGGRDYRPQDDESEDLQQPLGNGRHRPGNDDIFRDESASFDGSADGYEMSLSELLYSTSSFYAIAIPVTITMVLSALVVVNVNTQETIEAGAEAMADAYHVWDISSNDGNGISMGQKLLLSLGNSLVMVGVICMMTFVIVLLYKYHCMKCLIGYMIMCSATLLSFLGGNLYYTAIQIYNLPVDKITYVLQLWNFGAVGVLAIFWSDGIPKFITQGYLIATSVILAWHLDYFDAFTTWTLLFMLALYDLCAVLTPCGPLKALVDLMSREDSPQMPGLLFEADLPPEARRPGAPRPGSTNDYTPTPPRSTENVARTLNGRNQNDDDSGSGVWDNRSADLGPRIEVPLAIARVYNLPVVFIPPESRDVLGPAGDGSRPSQTPLLDDDSDVVTIPDEPTPTQLVSNVVVRLPPRGGRIQRMNKHGKVAYLERDRYGTPKRLLWIDRLGRVFAEPVDGDETDSGRNTIRLGLGDFIFYSVLVAKAAQYSFSTFIACVLVILAGLGGTLVLLSVYHHALPALPISICLGIVFYLATRVFIEPYIEAVLLKPYYV